MIRLLLLFFVTLILLSFGASNLDTVTIRFLPSDIQLELPLYLFFFISLSLGVIITSIYYKLKK